MAWQDDPIADSSAPTSGAASGWQSDPLVATAPPPKPQKTSQLLGFVEPQNQTIENINRLAESAAHQLGLSQDTQTQLANAPLPGMGGTSAQDIYSSLQPMRDYVAGAAGRNEKPGLPGQIAGNAVQAALFPELKGPKALWDFGSGALQSGLQSQGKTPEQVLADAVEGGGISTATGGMIRGGGKVIAPALSATEKALVERGWAPTFGEAWKGIPGAMEGLLQHVPGYSGGVRAARGASAKTWPQAALDVAQDKLASSPTIPTLRDASIAQSHLGAGISAGTPSDWAKVLNNWSADLKKGGTQFFQDLSKSAPPALTKPMPSTVASGGHGVGPAMAALIGEHMFEKVMPKIAALDPFHGWGAAAAAAGSAAPYTAPGRALVHHWVRPDAARATAGAAVRGVARPAGAGVAGAQTGNQSPQQQPWWSAWMPSF
jgi:hypothetical protein